MRCGTGVPETGPFPSMPSNPSTIPTPQLRIIRWAPRYML